jgi:hypothetical protein
VVAGSLPDGKYTLITLHTKVEVLSGPRMTADDVNTFVRLFGDVNGDGMVNAQDKAVPKQAEADAGSPYAPDFEYDGRDFIDKTDIAQFDQQYKGRIDPPKRTPAVFPGRKVRHRLAAHHPTMTVRPARTHVVKSVVLSIDPMFDRLPPGRGDRG